MTSECCNMWDKNVSLSVHIPRRGLWLEGVSKQMRTGMETGAFHLSWDQQQRWSALTQEVIVAVSRSCLLRKEKEKRKSFCVFISTLKRHPYDIILFVLTLQKEWKK